MEVDGAESWSNNSSDGGKFANLKAFVTAAREFEASHSESAVNLMTRYLGLIASSCDLSIFSPGRSEVCAFFSSLWRVMCDRRGPHWAGVAVLARACIEPNARHALTHTYRFMPILARLLSDAVSNDKKIKLLSVMQDISYGIKISWQESYLSGLMKQLTDWITQPMTEPQHRTIGHKSLTVLVNVCYGNLPAIYALMRTVDTKDFVVHLITLKVRKLLCAGITSTNGVRRRQVLQLVKHHYFPSDQMNQVFGETLHGMSEVSIESLGNLSQASGACAARGEYLTSRRRGASEHMASLQHALAMLQATNSSQQDVLYSTQMQSERHKKTIEEQHKQLEDAETTLRGFRAKLAAERLDKENQKENLHKEFRAQLTNIENEMKAREKEAEERLRVAEAENKALQKKLEQQMPRVNETKPRTLHSRVNEIETIYILHCEDIIFINFILCI
ncbi:hypothetical protein O3G_MSEX012300 [Manduca sexta]|uniref:Uncharacterized protein n=1 Tax=Manduca sexta TaxID=7130 RepID=A0A921ZNG8_MANSE|nr:hypothetical protein O3G_MSEX012300 [Manduca sexta]